MSSNWDSPERDAAIQRLQSAYARLETDTIEHLATIVETLGGRSQSGVSKVAQQLSTSEGKPAGRPDTEEVTYDELVTFTKNLGLDVRLATRIWTVLVVRVTMLARERSGGGTTDEIKRTPVPIRAIREVIRVGPERYERMGPETGALLSLWAKTF